MPHFGQRDGGDEKMGRVLGVQPVEQSGIGPRLSCFADRIRVEHEVHSRTGLTRSSGIRGGSQSVVPRTESCHALSFCMERRAVVLRHDVRAGCFGEVPLGCRAVSQPNNSRAWPADSFLTFLTASSTVLMHDTLAVKSVWSKPVCSLRTAAFFSGLVFSNHGNFPADFVLVVVLVLIIAFLWLRGRGRSGSVFLKLMGCSPHSFLRAQMIQFPKES